jgi:hypothetical protein
MSGGRGDELKDEGGANAGPMFFIEKAGRVQMSPVEADRTVQSFLPVQYSAFVMTYIILPL